MRLREEGVPCNEYRVVVADNGGCAQLECTEFSREEDLGDVVMCTYEGQLIWVAHFHMWMFTET